jgi:hypothetical protein
VRSRRTEALSLAVVATRRALRWWFGDVNLGLYDLLIAICSTHRHVTRGRPSRSSHVN